MKSDLEPGGEFVVPVAHPALTGHFPGRPLVPGVVLLDHASRLISKRLPGRRIVGFSRVKFARPVRPGKRVEVTWGEICEGEVAFALSVDGRRVVEGCARVVYTRP